MTRRTDRLNSLLKEVIAEVILREVRHPEISPLLSITNVDVSKDLHHAKVYVSVIGSDKERTKTLAALESAAGFIAVHAAKKVVIRYFPQLTFKLDTSAETQMQIDAIIEKIHHEQDKRQ